MSDKAVPSPRGVTEGQGDESGSGGGIMVDFEVEDAADADTAQAKVSSLKLDFDRTDVEFWFNQLEMHLQTAEVKSQWTKRLLLHKQLPSDVVAEVKDLLRKNKATAGATPYKDLKDRILETFAAKPEEVFDKLEAMIMTGKPSQLLNQMINTACPSHPYLENCCAAGMVSGMWRRKLPTEVRKQIAGMSIVGKDIMRSTLTTADAVFTTGQAIAAVSAAALDTSADAPALQQPQVAAYGRRNQNQNKRPATSNASGNGRQNSNRPKLTMRETTDPHPDGPPPGACNTHYKYGKQAFKCRKPETCPWRNLPACKNNN